MNHQQAVTLLIDAAVFLMVVWAMMMWNVGRQIKAWLRLPTRTPINIWLVDRLDRVARWWLAGDIAANFNRAAELAHKNAELEERNSSLFNKRLFLYQKLDSAEQNIRELNAQLGRWRDAQGNMENLALRLEQSEIARNNVRTANVEIHKDLERWQAITKSYAKGWERMKAQRDRAIKLCMQLKRGQAWDAMQRGRFPMRDFFDLAAPPINWIRPDPERPWQGSSWPRNEYMDFYTRKATDQGYQGGRRWQGIDWASGIPDNDDAARKDADRSLASSIKITDQEITEAAEALNVAAALRKNEEAQLEIAALQNPYTQAATYEAIKRRLDPDRPWLGMTLKPGECACPSCAAERAAKLCNPGGL